MLPPAVDIADGIVEVLNTNSWEQTLEAQRTYYETRRYEQMADTYWVDVVPTEDTPSIPYRDRDAYADDSTVVVNVIRRCESKDNAIMDTVTSLAREIVRFMGKVGFDLEDGGVAQLLRITHLMLEVEPHEQLTVAVSRIQLTYRVGARS